MCTSNFCNVWTTEILTKEATLDVQHFFVLLFGEARRENLSVKNNTCLNKKIRG
jgi:hypothetical protein